MDITILASGSSGNCCLIDDGVTPLLLDCGLPFKEIQQKLNFKTSEIEACLITHSHADHCQGVKGLAKAGIDCFMNEATWQTLTPSSHRCHILKYPIDRFGIGSWEILAFDAVHDVPCVGYVLASPKIGKVLYLTDTAYTKFRFKGLTHILIGCDYSSDILKENVSNGSVDRELRRRVIQSHMSLETLLNMLQANDLSELREIHLLHLSNTNADADLFKRRVMELTGKPVYVH